MLFKSCISKRMIIKVKKENIKILIYADYTLQIHKLGDSKGTNELLFSWKGLVEFSKFVVMFN